MRQRTPGHVLSQGPMHNVVTTEDRRHKSSLELDMESLIEAIEEELESAEGQKRRKNLTKAKRLANRSLGRLREAARDVNLNRP